MKKNKNWIILVSILILLVVLFIGYKLIFNFTQPEGELFIPEECNHNPLMVKRVIDGDTFELCSGEIVRLLCVDTPEEKDQGYEEAKTFLETLILYREVRLESSNYQGNNTDKYNRLLRWVYVEDIDEEILVNKYLLEEGYGDILIIPPETCNEVSD
jgi:endonuclease YncB( thermonuclease family)